MERVEHLKIPLEQIKLATDNFAAENLLGWGGFGPVYKGELLQLSGQRMSVAVKRLDPKSLQGNREFLTEIAMLSSYKHKNLVSLVGFCDDGEEKILVYELMIRGSLDRYLNKTDLTWTQRLQICLGAANGLTYLHCHAGTDFRILHRDIKSANILVDEEWNAKISDLGLSRIGPSNQLVTFLISNVCGTPGYIDPQYLKTGTLTKESDVYSFGVMLFEVLSGRPAVVHNYEDERRFLAPFVEFLYKQDKWDEIINPDLMDQANLFSLRTFSKIAYQCLAENRAERPTIDTIIEELEFALDLQLNDCEGWKQKSLSIVNFEIPLQQIKLATNNFATENFLGKGGFGPVYKGELLNLSGQRMSIAVKRLDLKSLQGKREFVTDIAMLFSYTHQNLVSLVGFCNEGGEKILVYELMIRGSLDNYLNNYMDLNWMQRLHICLGAAKGLSFFHYYVGSDFRILHRDIKSSNILLDEDWKAKISDFGLSRIGPSNQLVTFLYSNICGTPGYVDPQYYKTGVLTKESNVYSFGVTLFEVLSGRPAVVHNYEDRRRFLAPFVEFLYQQDRSDEIINPDLMEQANLHSLRTFSKIAYQCLAENRAERPTIDMIIEELQYALDLQLGENHLIRVGTWGGPGGGYWSFVIPSNHKLKKIFVEHEDWIYSLAFATEDPNGQLHHTRRFGGYDPQGRREISEINLDGDEEITGASGTIGKTTGVYRNIIVVSSLSLVTNKKTHGPFGQIARNAFSVPWDKGVFAGFYGHSGYYLDRIGLYFAVS